MSDERRAALASRWDDIEGATVHARWSASPAARGAPPVVLVHGLVISSLYMTPTAERLAPFLPVFSPDLPGFGRSTKPRRVLPVPGLADALLAWMDAVALERPFLVGNSLGCQIIVDLAARYPSRVRGAVLAGPTIDARARTVPRQIGRWLLDWPRERPSLVPRHVRDYYEAGVWRAWRTLRYALADPVEEKLPAVRAPTLVVRGSRDPIVPQAWAEHVASALPRGSLRVIPGGAHAVNYSSPVAFAGLVRGFVEELARSGG